MTHELHWRKGTSRYYKAHITKDMFGCYILTLVWGGINSRLGNCKNHSFESLDELNSFVEALEKRRLQRGYVKITAGNYLGLGTINRRYG